MATIKFTSIDRDARTVTFDVDGSAVTRKIPVNYEGTIDDYIAACARGLATEADNAPKAIETPTYSRNDVIV